MSNPVWPLTFPAEFLVEAFTESPPNVLIRFETETGPAKVRPRFTTAPRTFSGAVTMTKAQLADFDVFYRDTVRSGELPFDWHDPRPGAAVPIALRFLKVEYTPHGSGQHWRVALTVESVPTAPVPTGYRAIVLADTPTAYWRLGEMSGTTAVDELGLFPGVYSGVVLGASPAIASGRAAFFNGSTASIDIPGSQTTLGVSGMTLLTAELWIKTTYASATQRFPFDKPKTSFSAYAFIVQNSVLTFRVGLAPGALADVVSSVAINDGLWHHVVGVKAADGLRIYVDGVLRGTSLSSFTIEDDQNQTARIGVHIGGDEFPGTLDEVALYRGVALSADRVTAHYLAGAPTWPATLAQDFLLAAYVETPPEDGLVRSSLQGLQIVRRRSAAAPAVIKGEITASRAQVATYQDFFTVTLAHGVLPFAWRDPRSQLVRRFRHTTVPTYVPIAPDRWTLRLEIEELPA